ncbi:MAG: phospholipid carrier-dependent glycosyltransferase [Candidatus Shapirobacteria bacterium]|jgi:4-amino-4-deoxy-L-arabinose transferase-like glycosyltransferase
MPTLIKNNFWLLLIIFLAAVLRFYNIGNYPTLNPDEAALGYNAYSLIQTGKDEHGASWPLHFKSFGDFKPGGYVYLAIPFIATFGLTPLAVRLPNLLLSLLTILYFYKIAFLFTKSRQISLISALFLAINPWHLHFSRGAWESSSALAFLVIGSYYFLVRRYFLFVLTFVASLYLYHSARIVAPLLALSYLFIHKSYFINHKSKLIFPILIGILLTFPVLFSFLKNGGTTRFGGVGLTADTGPLSRSEELLNHHMSTALPLRILHNRRVLYLMSWGQKYFSHFDLNFLFINGDEVPRSKVPDMGQLYLLQLPFLLYGIYIFFQSKIYHLKSKIFVLSWLLISPLASSFTFQAPSALRALPLVIPLTFLSALGFYWFTYHLSRTLYLVPCTLYLVSCLFYLDSYHNHYQKRYPFAWNYGFSQVIPYLNSQKDNYQNIYFTNKYDQPYILYLFFSKYPPQKIQSQIKLTPPDKFGFSTVSQIDNIYFGKIEWDKISTNSLIISSPDEKAPIPPIKTIEVQPNKAVFNIYQK